MENIFSVLAGVIFILAYVPYISAIIKGKTKPAKASWLIWGTVDLIILGGMYSKDALNGHIIGATFGAWIIFFLAVKRGTPGWSFLDKFILGMAGAGIVLWYLYGEPLFGVLIGLGLAFIGAIPTFVSTWKDYTKENKAAWVIFWISCIFAILAIPQWTFEDASQPLVFFLVESIMMYLLFINPILKRRK